VKVFAKKTRKQFSPVSARLPEVVAGRGNPGFVFVNGGKAIQTGNTCRPENEQEYQRQKAWQPLVPTSETNCKHGTISIDRRAEVARIYSGAGVEPSRRLSVKMAKLPAAFPLQFIISKHNDLTPFVR
jgi:hypothetical protein